MHFFHFKKTVCESTSPFIKLEDIMNAYYNDTQIKNGRAIPRDNFGDKLISLICNIVAILTCSAAVKIEKVLTCAALFFLFFGVIGSMESGSTSIGFGALVCLAISFVEYALLKSCVKKATSNK